MLSTSQTTAKLKLQLLSRLMYQFIHLDRIMSKEMLKLKMMIQIYLSWRRKKDWKESCSAKMMKALIMEKHQSKVRQQTKRAFFIQSFQSVVVQGTVSLVGVNPKDLAMYLPPELHVTYHLHGIYIQHSLGVHPCSTDP